MKFPQYRKYKNIETYFIITSAKNFEEIKVIGTKYSVSTVVANQFPEQLLIQDMLNNVDDRWDILHESEFLAKKEDIKESKIKIG